MSTCTRTSRELLFETHDGTRLFYRHWPVTGALRRGAVVLFHRGHEHSGRMAHLVDELDMPDFDFFAWDARGHGRSPGPRGFSPSFSDSVRDVQAFMDHLRDVHAMPTELVYVVAQSVAAVQIATWVHDYAPRIRGMSLASPAFRVKLYVPFARPALALAHRLFGNFFVNSYVKSRFLTHDPERIASYDRDPLITRPISVNVLLGLYEAAERVVQDAQAITVPTQLLISGADWVVRHGPQHRFFERLGSTTRHKLELRGFHHDTLGERDRARAVEAVRDFALRQFDKPETARDLSQADVHGHTHDEAQALARPLPLLSPRRLYWTAVRLSLRIGALLSHGLALGRHTGFDSGSTLDYVYRNVPHGLGPLGRLVDRIYLQSIGWRGIRRRKTHLEELLLEAFSHVTACGKHVSLIDIAAGHGRYVIDAVQRSPVPVRSVLLRDYSETNVREGEALIGARGLGEIARFELANAFDRESIATVEPRPTVAVVSGLYELFHDNHGVRGSLAGLAEALPAGGCLVYTGQPWHPQLELIARVLTSHRRGQAWVMRRRTQGELDRLVEEAGFRKVMQRVDEWGIFTVSLAVRGFN